jgi:protein-disulfide isomerase
MQRRVLLASAAAALSVGGGWVLTRPAGPDFALPGAANAQEATPTEPTTPEPAPDAPVVTEMIAGNPLARVEVIEYASFTCPHCAAFHADQYQQLKADYIDTGKIRFVYREIYFDRFGLWASMIARCGGPDRFFGIAEMIYAQQQDWIAGGADPALIADNLRQIGRVAGLDDATLDACMADEATAQALVAWFEENSARDGIDSTPSFLINGEKFSNMPYAEFVTILEARLAE